MKPQSCVPCLCWDALLKRERKRIGGDMAMKALVSADRPVVWIWHPDDPKQYSWPLGLKNSRQEAEEDLESVALAKSPAKRPPVSFIEREPKRKSVKKQGRRWRNGPKADCSASDSRSLRGGVKGKPCRGTAGLNPLGSRAG
jgi:hypothetical protein